MKVEKIILKAYKKKFRVSSQRIKLFSGNVTVPENRAKKNSKAYKKTIIVQWQNLFGIHLKIITYATNRKI